jgi:N-acetylneuraminate synthase
MFATGRSYIIAEAGVNHNGSLVMAKELVDVAAGAGADAVKFQTFSADRLVSKIVPKAEYQMRMTDAGESQHEMLRRLELDANAHLKLIGHCRQRGIQFLSTAFDLESVDLLAGTLDLPILKLPSGEITNAPLLVKAASTGKPVILSTGMSTLGEVEVALGALAFGYTNYNAPPCEMAFRLAYARQEGQMALRERVTLLHCTSEYPAPFADVNLRVMKTLSAAFGLRVGFSDHSEGIAASVAAAALGATVIEKHVTLDRTLPGPDHKASLEPDELRSLVRSIRQVEESLGSPLKLPTSSEVKNMAVARKSIVAAREIRKGEPFSAENLDVKRPGTGLSPLHYWDLLGRKAVRDFARDEVVEIRACRLSFWGRAVTRKS